MDGLALGLGSVRGSPGPLCGHIAVAFAFEVFPDLVFDGFEHTIGVLAFGLHGEILFHG